MTNRSYNQLCGLAYALDIIGERWTLLIIRELIAGPRRFVDLMEGLPGISTNLLTERLKGLEESGLIRRSFLPPPAGSAVYTLTPLGQMLEASLLELGKWGRQFIPPVLPEGQHILHVGSYALTPKTFFRPELAQGLNETYALHIGNEIQQVRIVDGTISVKQGEPPQADVTLRAPVPIYLGLLLGELDLDGALAQGLVQVDGKLEALRRYLAICQVAPVEHSAVRCTG